jgi:hypothetical protein
MRGLSGCGFRVPSANPGNERDNLCGTKLPGHQIHHLGLGAYWLFLRRAVLNSSALVPDAHHFLRDAVHLDVYWHRPIVVTDMRARRQRHRLLRAGPFSMIDGGADD